MSVKNPPRIATKLLTFNPSAVLADGTTTVNYSINCQFLVRRIIVKCGYFITSDNLDVYYNSINTLSPIAGQSLFTIASNPIVNGVDFNMSQDLTDNNSVVIYFNEPKQIIGDYQFNYDSTQGSTLSGLITLLFEFREE